jgi:hypothetical protein
VTFLRLAAFCSWSRATSSVASYPTTLAVYCLPVVTSVALIVVAPSITWLLVSTRPSLLSTMPVPSAVSCW